MNTCKWFNFFILLFCLSCDKPLPSLEGMDLQRWKEDKNGCNNMRISMHKAIDREKNKLLSLDEMQIVSLLGRPDQNELYKRNQKFFYYFLEPAELCPGKHKANPLRLVIRFNAMGLAKEVMIN
jgi:hypothetical protein